VTAPVTSGGFRRGDDGVTLVELMVSATITTVLAVVAGTVTIATWKAQQIRSVSSQRTGAAKLASELLSRDLRDARRVTITSTGADPSSPGSVTVWDDTNLDYRTQTAENVTWTVTAGRLCRTTAVPTARCVTADPTTVTFHNVPASPGGGYRNVVVSLSAGPDSPARTWSVALENLR
jgi:Tfp pilus assembly protein PilW